MHQPVAVGTDVVSISRIQEALDRSGDRFTRRFFSRKEQAFCNLQSQRARHYAVRWAAKEAVFKSIPGYPAVTIPWREVGLETPLGCGPRLRISNSHLSRLGLDFEVTLAQKGDAVMACVVAHRFKKGEL